MRWIAGSDVFAGLPEAETLNGSWAESSITAGVGSVGKADPEMRVGATVNRATGTKVTTARPNPGLQCRNEWQKPPPVRANSQVTAPERHRVGRVP